MNHVPNRNGKILEETLAGSNSDAVKKSRRLCYFKKILRLLQVLQRSLLIPLPLYHMQ